MGRFVLTVSLAGQPPVHWMPALHCVSLNTFTVDCAVFFHDPSGAGWVGSSVAQREHAEASCLTASQTNISSADCR